MNRERALKERRELKQEKREARKLAAAGPQETETVAEEPEAETE